MFLSSFRSETFIFLIFLQNFCIFLNFCHPILVLDPENCKILQNSNTPLHLKWHSRDGQYYFTRLFYFSITWKNVGEYFWGILDTQISTPNKFSLAALASIKSDINHSSIFGKFTLELHFLKALKSPKKPRSRFGFRVSRLGLDFEWKGFGFRVGLQKLIIFKVSGLAIRGLKWIYRGFFGFQVPVPVPGRIPDFLR